MQKDHKDNWKKRRQVINICLLFIGTMTVYLAIWGKDDDLRRQIADSLLTTGMWLVLGYTGGAIVDDHLKRGGGIYGLSRNHQMGGDRDNCPGSDSGDDSSLSQGDGNIRPE